MLGARKGLGFSLFDLLKGFPSNFCHFMEGAPSYERSVVVLY